MKQDAKTSICLCTVTSEGFIPGTRVLFHTFLKHNPWFEGDLVVITDHVDTNMEHSLSVFSKVVFHPPDDILKRKLEVLSLELPVLVPRIRRFYSLELFNLIGYDKIIFFDSDMLVTGDFSDILKGEGPIAACSDMPLQSKRMVRDRITFRRIGPEKILEGQPILRGTFNAGMMVITPEFMTNGAYSGLLELVSPAVFSNVRTHNTDQVALNLFFDGQATILSPLFNMPVHKWRVYMANNLQNTCGLRALHFSGQPKPWELPHGTPESADDQTIALLFKAWNEADKEAKCR